jgi:protein O-GlcNAc transferase
MGVPVVTLAGEPHMSRVGATILRNAGLDELIASSAEDYVNKAVALAGDAARRSALRASLRARMLESPLLDHAGFTRKLEDHCRGVWRTWCDSRRAA